MTQPTNPRVRALFELEYPQSVAVFDSYPQAQAAVDHLSDQKFAVENLAIVGTDLKSVERVTGRRNWGTVVISGLQSGVSTGLMVAFILWFLQPQANLLTLLPGAMLIGILIGMAFAAIGYAASRGKRDFNSVSQTVAAKYEVLCEHKVAAQARELLAGAPGARAAQFDPRNQPAPWQPEQQTQYSPPGGYPPQQAQPGYGQAPPPGYGSPQAYHTQPGQGQAAPSSQSAPQPTAPQQPYGQQPYGSYGTGEGIGQAPVSDQDGRTPRGDN